MGADGARDGHPRCLGHLLVSALEIPTPWQIIEDAKGFLHIHHPNEDDGETQGDLVATVFQDERHAHLLKAAPEMLAALVALRDEFFPSPQPDDYGEWNGARAAIARATGADA